MTTSFADPMREGVPPYLNIIVIAGLGELFRV